MRTSDLTRNRIERLCYSVFSLVVLLMLHLFRLQVIQHHDVSPPKVRTEILVPRRGCIYTRDGVALAVSPEGKQVCANPRAVRNRERAAQVLSPILGVPADDLLRALYKTGTDASPNYYVLLKRRIDETTANRIETCVHELGESATKLHPPSIYLHPYNYRHYTRGRFAAQLLGFVNSQGRGVEGIERYWDAILGGKPGLMQSEVDAIGNPIPNGRKKFAPPVEGKHVILTIDDFVQYYAEEAIQKVWEKYKPNWVSALVMNPKTGAVLAMATKPDIDPNHIPHSLNGREINRPVQFTYEPGSTFKVVTACAALEELPPATVQKKFNCTGQIRAGRHTIHCWILAKQGHGHGAQGLSDGISNSCNIAMAGFARCIGAERFYRRIESFGFSEPTGVGCAHEGRGYVPLVDTWDAARLANISFGQSLTVTPIQLLRAVCAIANDGVMMQPYIVREIRTAEGKVDCTFPPRPIRRVVSVPTARRVTAMMERVVHEGTGKKAAVEGYRVAGKTGTAQKVVNRVFARGKYVASFVGFLPAENPRLAILVVADEPKGSFYGSVVCAPAFREIAARSMIRTRIDEPRLVAQKPLAGGSSVP